MRWNYLCWTVACAFGAACGPTVGVDSADGTDGATSATTSSGPPLTGNVTLPTGPDATAEAGDDTSTTTGAPMMPTDCGDGVLTDARVRITDGPEDERASLEGIAVIDGDLVIKNAADTNLSFLQCIREVTGNLYVYDNDALVDTDGLYWIERVGGDVVIAENDALVEFTGLAQLTEIEGDAGDPLSESAHSLFVLGNASLQRLSGLTSLLFVAGDLHIRDNPLLLDVDALAGLMLVGRTLAINHNQSLCASSVNVIGRTVTLGDPDDSVTNANDEGC